MKKNMYRNIKGRKVHVNFLASQSRTHTVNNIPKKKPTFEQKDLLKVEFNDGKDVHFVQKSTEWDKKKYPQPKNLRKRCHGQKWIKYKDGTVELKKWDYPSEFPNPRDYQKKLWKNLGRAAKMEAYTQDKMKKWERKHPRPCETDDLFKEEFIPLWEKEREEALERIRDFVVSMFDKLPLTGRFKMSEKNAVYQEKKIADIKDINGEGHKVNELGPESKLLNKAQKITNKTHAKNPSLVAANLKDHKRKKGRMILPQAA